MSVELKTISWSRSELGTAMQALARRTGLSPRAVATTAPPSTSMDLDPHALREWISAAADWMGIEAEPAEALYDNAEPFLLGAGPALLPVAVHGECRFVALVRGRRGTASILRPDLEIAHIPVQELRAILCRELESPLRTDVDALLERAGVTPQRRAEARRAVLGERLRGRPINECWLLRCSPGSSVWVQAKRQRLPQRMLALSAIHAVEYAVLLVAWKLIGHGAFEGRLDLGWLLAWALLLLTLIPFRMFATWLRGRLAIGSGTLVKQRLLYGALRLKPEEVRHKGVGQFMGQVIESEAIESLALSVGFQGLTAVIELIGAAVVLAVFAHSTFAFVLLLAWTLVTLALSWHYFRRRQKWTVMRLSLTHDLTESMVGHRTRLAQQPREHWHEDEDDALERYLGLSQKMDTAAVLLSALAARGWLVVGLLGLVPAFMSAQSGASTLFVSLGGMLLAYQAFQKLTLGLASLSDAAISWQQIKPVFHSAARPRVFGPPELVARNTPDEEHVVVEGHDLTFRYADRERPVLQCCSLRVRSGERLLLEGASGGGKSTLASLLIGLRSPQSGLLLLDGMDRATLGDEGWQRRIVSAPQFHENHVLNATFAFNLLMGRSWPPTQKDFNEAEQVCRELGLGELLDRMPSGLMQTVGETGWQLSHGERSRMFIARALLQGADMIVLDESFAALDPQTLRRSLECVLSRASTLMIIAHP